jgi:putative component of toxin-antitoxin plasmid stabilization module
MLDANLISIVGDVIEQDIETLFVDLEEKNVLKTSLVSSKSTDKNTEEAVDTKRAGNLSFHEKKRDKLLKWYNSLNSTQQDSLKDSVAYVDISEYVVSDRFKNIGEGLFEVREHKHGLRLYVFFIQRVPMAIGAGNKASQDADIKEARGFINDFSK